MKNNKSTYFDIKSFVITYSPYLLGAFALFVDLPRDYANFRLILIWLSLILSSFIIMIRKEIPRLYPLESIRGRGAQIIGGVTFLFWSIVGILMIIYS